MTPPCLEWTVSLQVPAQIPFQRATMLDTWLKRKNQREYLALPCPPTTPPSHTQRRTSARSWGARRSTKSRKRWSDRTAVAWDAPKWIRTSRPPTSTPPTTNLLPALTREVVDLAAFRLDYLEAKICSQNQDTVHTKSLSEKKVSFSHHCLYYFFVCVFVCMFYCSH